MLSECICSLHIVSDFSHFRDFPEFSILFLFIFSLAPGESVANGFCIQGHRFVFFLFNISNKVHCESSSSSQTKLLLSEEGNEQGKTSCLLVWLDVCKLQQQEYDSVMANVMKILYSGHWRLSNPLLLPQSY